MSFLSANAIKSSAAAKSYRSRSGWVAHHFISFSATRMLHCSARMGVREAFFSWEWETAEPASRFFLAAARRVLDSTRGVGNREVTEEAAAASEDLTKVLRFMRVVESRV